LSEYILELNGITKIFPGVKALDNVHFNLKAGEIHALAGENGASSRVATCCRAASAAR